ncbi:MAG: STAS domain-containing protein [Nitrospirae bacterium]|nr:STAS domain-containing protein [Nitrospirota bacterium]
MKEIDIKNGRLTMNGEMTISNSMEIKEALLNAIQNPEPVILDLGGVTGADVAFLQILVSSGYQKKEFKIENPSREFLQVVERTGFSHYLKPLFT